MNVLHLVNFAGKGGSEKYIYTLIRRERERGVTCTLVYNEEGPLCDRVRRMGVAMYRLPMKSIFDIEASKTLAYICAQRRIDVIHTHFPRENCIAILAGLWRGGMKVVNTSHLVFETGFAWRIINKIFSPWNHKVICVCNEQVEKLVHNGVKRKKLCVIHNGIPPIEDDGANEERRTRIRSEFGIAPDAPLFCTLTRYEPVKGVDVLIKAAAELKKTVPEARILIAGDGEQFEEMKNLRHELGLDDMVIMAGYRTDGRDILAASDVFVSSSRSEALSFAVIEAMAMSLPVIVSRVGGNPDIVEGCGCGLMFENEDHAELAAHMKGLARDGDARMNMGKNAKARADSEFSEKKMIDDTIAVYYTNKKGEKENGQESKKA